MSDKARVEDVARNSKENAIKEICAKALRRVTPKRKEREETLRFARNLAKGLNERLRGASIRADVNVQGSVAKDTWLAGEKDIDVFITLPKTYTKEIFPKVLEVVKSFAGERWIEAYAEHPYIEAEIEGYKIDFVPCFKIERSEKKASSVDRTPLHTAYVKGKLDQQTKDEIRLFKQFARGIGVYGAEIKVKGLSGYLCELLILYYGSFLKTLQEIASWRFGQVLDIENLYDGRIDEMKRLFNAPLIVVDPVDASRNVAAVVSRDRLGELMMAAKLFLAKPDDSFFFPAKTGCLSVDALNRTMPRLGFDLVFVLFRYRKTVPDVLWGQLYKTSEGLRKLLTQNDFQVLKNEVWSDEREVNALVFGLETAKISPSKRHLGPPVDSEEAISFIGKHAKSDVTGIGPWAEGGRWITCVRRRYADAASLLKEALRNGGKDVRVAGGMAGDLKEAEVYVNGEILDFYASSEGFAPFLTDFLRGRPKWMK